MTIETIKISLLRSVAFEQRQNLPPIPAVYFVLNAQLDIMYIGECADLQARWAGKKHQRAAQMREGGYRIHWYGIPGDALARKTAEKQAIEYYKPRWNRTEVPADEMKEVLRYVGNAARHMDIAPDELVCRILKEWAYSREVL